MDRKWNSKARGDRFDFESNDKKMKAVVTMSNGGYDKLELRQVKRPSLSRDEVLIKVLAAGINNTDINTRLGWYSSSVKSATLNISETELNQAQVKNDGGWNNISPFPFIQGSDCCGKVVEVYNDENFDLIGKRVLIRSCSISKDKWLGSDYDGSFAEYVKAASEDVFVVESNWSNEELATMPCSYATAENMLERAKLGEGDNILITGASGGVGSALVQLAKRRKAKITAISSKSKTDAILSLGVDKLWLRDSNLHNNYQNEMFDMIFDNVAGDNFSDLLDLLKRGGSYISSGAIAGPIVTLDMRKLYLKDLTLIGTTSWSSAVFSNLIKYIENDEIKPLVAKIYPLEEIKLAQKEFLEKKHVGNFVLTIK